MNYSENTLKFQDEPFEPMSEAEVLASLDRLIEDGFEADVKHVEHIPSGDSATEKTKRYDCFGKQSSFPTRPKACGHCKFGSKECLREGYRQQKVETDHRSASVIDFPTPARAISTPEAESPTERDSESATTTATQQPVSIQLLTGIRAGLQSMNTEEATAHLEQIAQEVRGTTATAYGEPLRAQFVAASIELCDRRVMPAFRDVYHGRFPKGRPASEHDETLSHDLRFIDLYWIAKHHATGRGMKFSKLLDSDGNLDHGKAWEFASLRRSHENKSNDLILTKQIQAELFMLKTKATEQKWYRLSLDRGEATTTIATAIARGHDRKKGDPEQLWQLYALCKMNGWTNKSEILGSASILFGQAVPPARLRTDIKWLAECFGIE